MLLFKQKLVGNGRERDKNTNYRFVSFRSNPMRNRKFQTNSKKIQKIINTIMASFQAKMRGETLRKKENKNYRYVPFQPDA